jgi:geranylgeranyl pyrophosphate synthase
MNSNGNLPRNTGSASLSDSLAAARDMMIDSFRSTSLAPVIDDIKGAICDGKMLRARLTFSVGSANNVSQDILLRAAAAVEMVHAASLLHDDVIDGGNLRRGAPSFWKRKGVSGAILLGDLLVCKALQLLNGTGSGRLGMMLVQLAEEMCDAEAEQELVAIGTTGDWERCVSIARRKTGSLFAFAAVAADGSDENLTKALLESGHRIGTAYQLADDILDARGTSVGDGKDLGKDAIKGKLTSVSAAGGSDAPARRCISDLYATSAELLSPWPSIHNAWNKYLETDFNPVVKLFAERHGHPI